MKLNRSAILIFVTLPFLVHAQFSKPEEKFVSDQERYIYPVYPGRPGSLAGTMGELRSTHFHSGIDIRTNNMVGLPVQASKSGYVSRIVVGGSGYGNVMYVTHGDGNTTLYAHLLKFLGPVGDHVLQEQYRRKANEVDLTFGEGEFKVQQGDTIAWSGNTGSTNGPHLHFDIRDAQNFALDPIKVAAFPELVDNYPPAAEKIALVTLDINSRINDQFGRFEFYVKRVGKDFVLPTPILASGTIGVELIAKDKLAAQSQFFGGVNYLEMRVDSQLVFKQAIERVNVEETRAIYTLMDFKTMRNKGSKFYKLYIDDGNDLPFYGQSPGSGKIRVNPDAHPSTESIVQIKMKDSDENASTVSFRLKPSKPLQEVKSLAAYSSANITVDFSENTMVLLSKYCTGIDNKAILYTGPKTFDITPAYNNSRQSVYLIDLRKTIPDSVIICGKTFIPRINAAVPSGTEYTYYSDLLDIRFPQNSLYDTLYLKTDHTLSNNGYEMFTIGSRTVPLHTTIDVWIRPQKTYEKEKNVAVYRDMGRYYVYLGGEWENGRIHFATREFGEFRVLRDSIPPAITPLSVSSVATRFRIRDDLSGIASMEASIDGRWVLMNYDVKSNTVWSTLLDPAVPLKGNFVFSVTDNAGNIARYEKNIQ